MTQGKRLSLDLTRGSIVPMIVRFSIPLVLGNLFQQLYHIVDGSVVGRYCGVEALAAISCTSWVCWLINAICRDSSNAFGIMGSVRAGAGNREEFRQIVANAALFTASASLLLVAAGILGLKMMLKALQIPANIVYSAEGYLLLYILCIPPMMLFQALAALLRALGNSQVTMTAMTASTVVNIILDLVFILVLHWGVIGAGLATLLSVVLSAGIGIHACRKDPAFHLCRKDLRPDWKLMREAASLLAPMLFNSVIISIGGLIVLSRTNALGSSFTAGLSAQGKLFGILEAVVMAFQTGVSVFVGQNLGAENPTRIRKGLHRMLLVVMGVFLCLAALTICFLRPLLNLFLSDSDPVAYAEAFRTAWDSTLCILGGMLIMTPMYIYRVTIQALGHAAYAAVAGFGQMIMRILTITVGPILIGVWAYYIPDCMAWLISLPIVAIPCYTVLRRLE